ncbi:MAG TPA: SpoIID/LytB domain-containing protein, partial [Kofleriaceae bacterium]|nr:SpoIID/LytB domain-containing protein [Kofleriaceae bacterium]
MAATVGACTPPGDAHVAEGVPVEETPERWQSGIELDDDRSGDLRPDAIALMDARDRGEPSPAIALAWQPPSTIRVWRRGLDGSSASCSGRVDVIPLETYVKGVLPHEWIRSWHRESLRAGAIAIRTYAANWIMNGGKYSCADLDDTTASQVYRDERFPVTNAAVDATARTFALKNGVPVFAEYSAENGHPTATGISDPPCAGKARYGHGRGTCQWGSQRWATQAKSHAWIIAHYYPGASVVKVGGAPSSSFVVDNNNANNDAA